MLEQTAPVPSGRGGIGAARAVGGGADVNEPEESR